MSADNYLQIREDGRVYEGSASSDEDPSFLVHEAATVKDAVVWADEYCCLNIVEYGYLLTPEARKALKNES